MMNSKFQALAASGRCANLPSVVSNLWCGAAIASVITGKLPHNPNIWLTLVSAIALYLSGNFLNDWADRSWDQKHRPERALPRQLFKPHTYLALAIALCAIACLCASLASALAGILAGMITTSIITYTWIHKSTPWSVIPMGLCRALLPLMGYVGANPSWDFPPPLLAISGALFCYIVSLSVNARMESNPNRSPHSPPFAAIGFLIAGLSAGFAAISLNPSHPFTQIAAATPYAIWTLCCLTIYRSPIPRQISNLLAGIPWLDAIVLIPIPLISIKSTPFGITCMLMPPLAFMLAKCLQRLAPAT